MSIFFAILAYVSLFCLVALPPYLIWSKSRFWAAFFVAWFMMVLGQWFDVESSMAAIPAEDIVQFSGGGKMYKSGAIVSDTTSVGLTMFSGWLLAMPYCLVLNLSRKLFRWVRRPPQIPPNTGDDEGEQNAAAEPPGLL